MLCFGLLLPSCIFPALAVDKDEQTHADMVLVNGAIYTMDASRSWASALAIKNGRIAYVGNDRTAVSYAGPLTNVVNLEKRMVLPGLIDSHIHAIDGELEEAGCYLANYESVDSIKKAIKDYASENQTKPWVVGSGWALPVFGKQGPEKALLDEIVPDRPAYMVAQDGHSAWVNSKALELAGISAFSPDPQGGRIERKEGSKEPSGTLRESAMNVFASLVPKPSQEEYREAALKVQKRLNALGITAVQDACVNEDELKAYASLDDSNLLSMRVSAAMQLNAEKGESEIKKFKQWRELYDGNLLSARAVKIFADGVIESKTAALLEPYLGGDAGDRGILEVQSGTFKWFATKLNQEGFQLHIHAIGDRAVRTALDAVETSQKILGKNDLRHHIAHLELIDKADLNRFRSLNVAANFQAYWAYRDKYVSDLTEPILGKERCKRLYQINSVYKSGAMIIGGSDWTVTTANPLEAIQVAVTRCALNEGPEKAFLPEESIGLSEILAAYTINGAYIGHWEKESGSLEPGKSADLILLDKNLFEIPPTQIHKTKVLWTIFKGRTVHRDIAFEI